MDTQPTPAAPDSDQPVPAVVIVAPAEEKPTRPARKWDAASPSIEDVRAFGLTYLGGGTVQGSNGRMLPASNLDPEIAATYVKDRPTLLAVLDTKYYAIAYPSAESKE